MIRNVAWRILLITLIFLIARSAYFVGFDAYHTVQSGGWPSTIGKIVKIADATTETQQKSWAKDKIIEYKYSVKGEDFNGNKISFSRRKKWYYDEVNKLVAPWRLDGNVTVFYSPDKAGLSVINPGGSNVANIAFLCAQILGITVLAAALTWSIYLSNKKGAPSI